MRPGFGFPGDDFRIEQARRIYAGGLQFANQVQNEIDWWIFWGRVAGGSLGVFMVLLAFLAGRMRAGDDPGLASSTSKSPKASTQTQTQSRSQSQSQAQTQTQSDPNPPTTHSS